MRSKAFFLLYFYGIYDSQWLFYKETKPREARAAFLISVPGKFPPQTPQKAMHQEGLAPHLCQQKDFYHKCHKKTTEK